MEIIVPLAFFTSIVVLVLGLRLIAYKQSHREAAPQDAGALAAVEQRLARVEVALDDLASELGRVAEGQQFLTKVLTDRTPDAAHLSAGAPPR
ncbi:MAG TPA: hypothetical protein VNW46_15520 [Gemmatimonadaceae bacterium]|nr:hypothetical protein [Gemmatimonadaceae bacterium]